MLLVVALSLRAAIRGFRATHNSAYALPLGLLVFGLINAGFESGMIVINLVPFLLGCCLIRLALFREVGCDKLAKQAPAHLSIANMVGRRPLSRPCPTLQEIR